jgi:hypothetical protein
MSGPTVRLSEAIAYVEVEIVWDPVVKNPAWSRWLSPHKAALPPASSRMARNMAPAPDTSRARRPRPSDLDGGPTAMGAAGAEIWVGGSVEVKRPMAPWCHRSGSKALRRTGVLGVDSRTGDL